jgi:dethiobiotin synthetase
MNAYFVTSCGTDIGKTYVTSVLLKACALTGKKVNALKPVLSGAMFGEDDASSLLAALGVKETDEARAIIAPFAFTAPLSPHHAAALEGRTLKAETVIAYCKDYIEASNPDIMLIEGAGGVAVPINTHELMVDIIIGLHMPVIFVTGDYLGSISHTLTALNMLHMRGVRVDYIIINQSEDSVGLDAMCDTIKTFSPFDAPIVKVMRSDSASMLQQHGLIEVAEAICTIVT